MSVPQPKGELEGHCSAVHDDTLYVLSPSGFQSLPLKENATWTEEEIGKAVTGPACVHAKSQKALYVVGGTTDDDSYDGLQRYSFQSKKWETLSPPTKDMRGRTNHSAAYLADSKSILVYAGSRPDSSAYLSSQTFLINLEAPYNLEAFTSKAPPANQPILEPWNGSHAVMVGGSETNTDVFLFDDSNGWQEYSTSLEDPIDPAARGTILDGSDGSKVLEVYNVHKSPNGVSQFVLQGSDGQPAATGTTVGDISSSRKRKRDLTLSNWPSYNSTNAPTATRTDCGLAQGPSGLSVISGGNSDLPVALFNRNENSWVDASQFFNSKDMQEPLQPSSTQSSSPSASATTSAEPSASTTAAADSGGGMTAHQKMLRTLGITLGVLFGIAAVFIIVLLFLRYRRNKQKKQEGYIDEKAGDRMSFQDRGASFMKEAGGSIKELEPPSKNRYGSGAPRGGGSHNSLAIIAGKINGSNNRNLGSDQPKQSFESTARLVKDKNSSNASEPMEMMDIGDKALSMRPAARKEHTPPSVMNDYEIEKELTPLEGRSRSSGWSKYFATSGPTGPNGISHLPVAYLKNQTASGVTDDRSEYSRGTSQQPSRIPSSILVPPLDIDFAKTLDGQRLSHVASGSPSFNDSREDLAKRGSLGEGQAGTIVTPRPGSSRPGSSRSQISGHSLSTNKRTTLSSNFTSDYYNESGQTPWTPTSNRFTFDERPPSSVYTASVHDPRTYSRGKNSGFFPGAGTSYRPTTSSKPGPTAALKSSTLGAGRPDENRESTMTVFPSGAPNQNQGQNQNSTIHPSVVPSSAAVPSWAAPPPTVAFGNADQGRDSTMTVFPSGAPNQNQDQNQNPTPHRNVVPSSAAAPSWAAPPPVITLGHSDQGRDSTMTVFPSGADEGSPATTGSGAGRSDAPSSGLTAPPPITVNGGNPAQGRDSTVTLFPSGIDNQDFASGPRGGLAPAAAPSSKLAAPPIKLNGNSLSSSRDSTMTVFPSGLENGESGTAPSNAQDTTATRTLHSTAPKHNAFAAAGNQAESRDSTATIFPRGVPSEYYSDWEQAKADLARGREHQQSQNKPVQSDMSWLDLGHGNQNRI